MKTLKKTLALLLTLCMVLNVLSMTAMATDGGEGGETANQSVTPTGEGTDNQGEDANNQGEDANNQGEDANNQGEDANNQGEDANNQGEDADSQDNGIDAQSDDTEAQAEEIKVDVSPKPDNGNTEGQPFISNTTGGSYSFRIPGLVNHNGKLIAVADARWNTTDDASGLDTIVSVSTDKGEKWTYTFANYLGDNGNVRNDLSSCFIDPAIATNGTTAYLIADLFPAGFTTAGAKYKAQSGKTGFDTSGNLILRSDADNEIEFGSSTYATDAASANYGYYLKDGEIYKTDNTKVDGYSVDPYFNITYNDTNGKEVKTNLFFADSPYKPFPTNYLYMTTSGDGLEWSAPTLLNLKEADEQAFLVGPGSGIAVGDKMVFTAYEYNGDMNSQRTCLIWRNTDGSWHRSEPVTDTWSSEASVVDLGDDRLRVFYRDSNSYLSYSDMVWDVTTYARDDDATSVPTTAAKRAGTGCMLSAYKYSQKIEEKDVILVSTPATSGSRTNGYLYVFLVDPEDKSLELAYEYDITPGANETFAYSCITEVEAGKIALLWESQEKNPGRITFSTINMDDVTADKNDTRLTWVDTDLQLGESVTYTDYTGDYSSTNFSTNVATVEVIGNSMTATVGNRMSDSSTVVLDNCLYTFTSTGAANTYYISTTLSDGTTVYVEPYSTTVGNGCPNVEGDAETLAVQVQEGLDGNQVKLYSNGSLHFHSEKETPNWNRCGTSNGGDTTSGCNVLLLYRPVKDDEDSSTEIPGYVQINRSEIVSGGQYLIAAKNEKGNTYVLNPVSSTNSADHMAKVDSQKKTIATSEITFTGNTVGTDSVQIGSVVYNITVSERPAEEVEMNVGDTVTRTVEGAYTEDDITLNPTGFVDVDLTVTGATASGKLDASLNNGATVALTDCLYTFTAASDGTWYATIGKDDATRYISPVNYGHDSAQTAVWVAHNSDGSVYINNLHTDGKYQWLYVDRSTLKWDRVNSTTQNTMDDRFKPMCTFYIYGVGEDANSPIPGYKQITSANQIISGNGYLIAFYDVNNKLYVMNPLANVSGANLKNTAYQQMAEVVVDTTTASTTINITGVAAGETTLTVGDNEYDIIVHPEGYDPLAISASNYVNNYQGPEITMGEKPANGTTEGQPFLTNTGGSANFRIPGIVTLNDGTLIATTDARWTTTLDGGGLDTLVSVSDDNGKTWKYTFANYLGDNGNIHNNLSTCIIDPAIGTDGATAYMIADIFPAGIALNGATYAPVKGNTGFNEEGYLLLRDLNRDTVVIGQSGYNTEAAARAYNYYLKPIENPTDDARYQICTETGTVCDGFTVDAYFNITYNGHTTNLFFADSPLQPFPTNYLYLVTSEDGLTWSEPKLLNLKDADEQVLLVGPGNGTYDAKTGRMVFTAYEYTNGYQRTCLIWRETNGNWHRTEDATVSGWSSEASVVALDDGTLRVFYRDGNSYLSYTDFTWDANKGNYVREANATEVRTAATKNVGSSANGCQLSAIKYSKQIDDRDVILVSTPAAVGSRSNGYLYVFLLNENNTMELAYAYDIVPGGEETYAYSCITELKGDQSGNIGLLYEGNNPDTNGSAEIIYTIIDMDDVKVRDNDARLNFVDVTVLTGDTYTYTDNSGYYPDPNTDELDTSVATVTTTGSETTTNAAQVLSTGANIDLDSCQYTFTKNTDDTYTVSATLSDGTIVYLNHYASSGNNIPNITTPGPIEVLAGSGNNVDGMFKLMCQPNGNTSDQARSLHFHAEFTTPYWNRCRNDSTYTCHEYLFRKATDSETASTDIPGYVQVTKLTDIQNGGQYLIAAKNDDGNWYVLNPANSDTALDHVAQVKGLTTVGSTEVTFTGVGKGDTKVKIGSTVYRVTVAEFLTVKETIPVGESIVINDVADGNLDVADKTVVKATLADGVLTIEGLYPGETTVTLNRTKYVITVTGDVVDVTMTAGEEESYLTGGNKLAKAPEETIATASVSDTAVAQLGTDAKYDGDEVNLADCLYTFTANTDGTYVVSAKNNTVYLQAYASNNGYPNVSSSVNITVGDGSSDGTVTLAGNGGYLHFHRDGKNYFDRVKDTSGFEAATSFYLYAANSDGTYTAIDGKDAVEDDGKYLIVADAGEHGNFILYPTTSNTAGKYTQVAKMLGYTVTFKGVSAGETTARSGSTIFNIKVTAQYTVTLNYNDSVTPNGTVIYTHGDELGDLPTPPERDGYSFVGWKSGDTPVDKDTEVTSDMTLTAQWTKNEVSYKVTVKYGDDATADKTLENVKHGTKLNTLIDTPTRDGYVFAGWKDSEGYAVDEDAEVNRNMTLTAQWTPVYNVELVFIEGGTTNKTLTVKSGDKLTSLPTPSREGYTFAGWKDEAGNEVTAETVCNGNMKLTAQWTKNVESYTVELIFIEGGTATQSLTVKSGDKLTSLPTPSREGYTFTGWKDEAGNEVTAQTVCTGNMKLTAQWTENAKTYTVTLNYNDGTTANGQLTVTGGDKLTSLPTPTREGYTFGGWKDSTGTSVTKDTVVAGDMTLTAQWAENAKTYTVTLCYNDGKTVNGTLTVAGGEKLSSLPTPTREGYTFGGWKDSAGNSVTKDTVVTADMTLVAQWTQNAAQTQTPSDPASPNTGDSFPMVLMVMLMLLSLTGLILLFKRKTV